MVHPNQEFDATCLEQFDLPLDFFEENIPMPKQTSDYITRSESISGLREEEVASVRHNSLQNCDSYLPGCGPRQPLSGRIARTTEEHEDDAFFMYKDTVTWPPQNNSGVTTSQYAIPTTINAQLSILDPFSVVFGPQLPQTPSQQTYLSSIPEDPFNLMLTHPTYRNPTQSKTLLDTTLHTGPPQPQPQPSTPPSLYLPHPHPQPQSPPPSDAYRPSAFAGMRTKTANQISSRKRWQTPETAEEVAAEERLAKKRRVDAEKQRKSRSGKRERVEGMEAEIQRLRRIVENLGGEVGGEDGGGGC